MSASSDPIQLYAAGSLRAALTEISRAFEAESGAVVQSKFGPSGLLKDEIASGAHLDVFASANMEHPLALHAMGRCGPVKRFARNTLCALVRSDLPVNSESLLDRMLDPAIRLGTSTPKADPSGDYAFEVFRKVEAVRPGAGDRLAQKALQLTGNASSVRPPDGRSAYGWHVAEGRADIFLAYRTACREAKSQYSDLQIVDLPKPLAVGAEFGLAVITGASDEASLFTAFILAEAGQSILQSHGFGRPNS